MKISSAYSTTSIDIQIFRCSYSKKVVIYSGLIIDERIYWRNTCTMKKVVKFGGSSLASRSEERRVGKECL